MSHAAAAKSLQSCLTLRPYRRQPTRLPHPWDSPGKNTGVGCHCLLQICHMLLLLLLLSCFSRVWLCATPKTAGHQAPLSLGFSRQEHWSGLPFSSPMHESEKWKWSHSVVSDSQRPHGLQSTRFLHPWDFPGKSTGVGCHCLLRICHILTCISTPHKYILWEDLGRVPLLKHCKIH